MVECTYSIINGNYDTLIRMEEAAIQKRLDEVAEWLRKEFVTIRTGQATPALLDGIKVESYGALMPLNQTASIGIEDARTLRISPWDAGAVGAIETAIREADLGLSVAADSAGVRAIFPELTAERREQLNKVAKAKLEDARISVRNIRDEIMKEIDAAAKAGELSEDEKFSQKETVQKLIETANAKLEAAFADKAKELQA